MEVCRNAFIPILFFFIFTLGIVKVAADDISLKEHAKFANFLINNLYENYPNYLTNIIREYKEKSDISLRNESYKGYILEMKRNQGYEVLLADGYRRKFKNEIFESGKRPLTVLYKCDKGIS